MITSSGYGAGMPSSMGDEELFFGVAIGIVTKVNDPDHVGQVEIELPWLEGYRRWARVAQFYAGPDCGSTWRPDEKAEVLVGFDQGSLRSPYVIGCLHGKVDKPPHSRSASSDIRTLRTPAGSELTFDETNGTVTVKTKKGASIMLKEQSGEITITATSKISLDAPEVSIRGRKKVSINGGQINLN
jgi:uncharacterized protein involved in type VI secretion and phage assembly